MNKYTAVVDCFWLSVCELFALAAAADVANAVKLIYLRSR